MQLLIRLRNLMFWAYVYCNARLITAPMPFVWPKTWTHATMSPLTYLIVTRLENHNSVIPWLANRTMHNLFRPKNYCSPSQKKKNYCRAPARKEYYCSWHVLGLVHFLNFFSKRLLLLTWNTSDQKHRKKHKPQISLIKLKVISLIKIHQYYTSCTHTKRCFKVVVASFVSWLSSIGRRFPMHDGSYNTFWYSFIGSYTRCQVSVALAQVHFYCIWMIFSDFYLSFLLSFWHKSLFVV